MIRVSAAVCSALLVSALTTGAAPSQAQTQTRAAVPATPGPAAVLPADQWLGVAPENLLVIDTTKGRVLVALDPALAPAHVERVQTLTRRGFYDGLKFHRVLTGFMAQTGDPQGTGEGGSDLPDVRGEFTFRRGRGGSFQPVAGGGDGFRGYFDGVPIQTQPDAQMFVTADMKVAAHVLFCPGVAGMARSSSPDSANSQFYLMTGRSDPLNGQYTAFGRIVGGLDVVKALKAGPEGQNGTVGEGADLMTRVQLADAIPAARRPTARIMDPRSPSFVARVEAARATAGLTFNVCDVDVPVEATGS